MANVTLIKTSSGIEKQLKLMVERGKSMSAFLNRVTYPQYQQAQVKRWETSGSSEGFTWDPPKSQSYRDYKVRLAIGAKAKSNKERKTPKNARPADNMSPTGKAAGGQVNMILTGRLADAAMGRGRAPGTLKVVTTSGITVAIDDTLLPYAKYASVNRPTMLFSSDTEQRMVDDIVRYMMTGDGL